MSLYRVVYINSYRVVYVYVSIGTGEEEVDMTGE